MKRTTRALAVAGMAAALFSVGALGLSRKVEPQRVPPITTGAAAALRSLPPVASGSLVDLIAGLQQRLRTEPHDWRSLGQLGIAYVQLARVTADPSYYPKAEEVLERSLQLHGEGNLDALLGMATLAAARHNFSGSLMWAERARSQAPHSADVHAVLGDALVELGRYEEAFDTFQTMVDLRPGLSTYARVSYAWELQGNHRNAVKAMELALSAAASPEDVAWASAHLGDLHLGAGRLEDAAMQYRRALSADDGFVPARAGLAKVDAARGDIDGAIRGMTWVVERMPTPEYVILLGDLLTSAGEEALAARQYALVEVQERLLRANGVNVDLEIALFQADHGIDPAGALAAARAEWARRRSIHAADALAWTLHANGRHREALVFADKALRLGTRNALFLYHRGMILRALGRNRMAEADLSGALEVNPHFSVLGAGEARRALDRLRGAP